MTWESYRRLVEDKEVNVDTTDWSWEEEHIPLLHSGFLESTTGKKPRARLSITLVFAKGHYSAKVSDRVSRCSVWLELAGLNEFLLNIEELIKAGDIHWENDEWSGNGA